ncbi:MAG TPA: hypothetical protein VGR15_03670, partial [Bacteroidota bacterium]|nr:hypothetical protein [Bacteroidota bacterium]
KEDLTGTELITVEHGGVVKAKFELTTSTGKKVHARAELRVPDHAVNQDVQITMTLATDRVAVEFQPEGLVFNEPARLDFHVNHLNQIPEDETVTFVFVDENGNTSSPTYEDLDVHRHSDHTDIHLKNAEISHFSIGHFSIYAFGR